MVCALSSWIGYVFFKDASQVFTENLGTLISTCLMTHTTLNQLNAVLSRAYTIDRKIPSLNRGYLWRKEAFLKRECLQSDNMTTDLNHSRPLRDHFLPLIMPTMLWIKTHQPWARFVMHQSLTTSVVQIVWLSKSTLSPELHSAVERSRSISKWQSWDKW